MDIFYYIKWGHSINFLALLSQNKDVSERFGDRLSDVSPEPTPGRIGSAGALPSAMKKAIDRIRSIASNYKTLVLNFHRDA